MPYARPFRPLSDPPPQIRRAGVRLKLVPTFPRRYRSRRHPSWVWPLSAAWMLGLGLLLGMAVGEGRAVSRFRPVVAGHMETIKAVINQSLQAECVAVAMSIGLTYPLKVSLVGPEMALWAPQLLSEADQARCGAVIPAEPIETHWPGEVD